jgi:hypothetical protein
MIDTFNTVVEATQPEKKLNYEDVTKGQLLIKLNSKAFREMKHKAGINYFLTPKTLTKSQG